MSDDKKNTPNPLDIIREAQAAMRAANEQFPRLRQEMEDINTRLSNLDQKYAEAAELILKYLDDQKKK